MKTPYQILDVSSDATDDEIKKSYLQQVKLYPPDRDQQKFLLIHDAYTRIRDIKSRLRYELFNVPEVDFNQIIDQVLMSANEDTITVDQFNTLFGNCIDSDLFQNAFTVAKK